MAAPGRTVGRYGADSAKLRDEQEVSATLMRPPTPASRELLDVRSPGASVAGTISALPYRHCGDNEHGNHSNILGTAIDIVSRP